MAFCANCGTQVVGSFCPNCGTPMGAAATAGTAGTNAPPVAQTAGLSENAASALCYLLGFVTGIIFLVLAPYNQNKTVRFHAFQAIFFHVAFIILWIGYSIISLFLTVITHGILIVLYPLFGLLFFVLWLYLMYSAYNKKKVKLPFIGDLAEKQA